MDSTTRTHQLHPWRPCGSNDHRNAVPDGTSCRILKLPYATERCGRNSIVSAEGSCFHPKRPERVCTEIPKGVLQEVKRVHTVCRQFRVRHLPVFARAVRQLGYKAHITAQAQWILTLTPLKPGFPEAPLCRNRWNVSLLPTCCEKIGRFVSRQRYFAHF